MAKLLHFVKGADEYVVIQDDSEAEAEEYAKPGFELRIGDTVELGDLDVSRLPCDRTLMAE